jgi:ERCC4-related helicase
VLVFVERRDVAQQLSDYLQKELVDWKCLKLIGQGKADGMKWGGANGQCATLEKFREDDKNSHLIVCTSVLEEGLDVSSCDLVVRFGGKLTLIQLVQSRGRARAENGKLIIISTPEERKHFEDLIEKEIITNSTLHQYSDY